VIRSQKAKKLNCQQQQQQQQQQAPHLQLHLLLRQGHQLITMVYTLKIPLLPLSVLRHRVQQLLASRLKSPQASTHR
jgi:hypothetical protein